LGTHNEVNRPQTATVASARISFYLQLGEPEAPHGLRSASKDRSAGPRLQTSVHCAARRWTWSSSPIAIWTTSAACPFFFREQPQVPVIMTQPSHMLIERMLHNSASVMEPPAGRGQYPRLSAVHSRRESTAAPDRLTPLPYGHAKRSTAAAMISKSSFTSGSCGRRRRVEIHYKHRKLFFTGDVLFGAQRTCPAAKFPIDRFDPRDGNDARGRPNARRPGPGARGRAPGHRHQRNHPTRRFDAHVRPSPLGRMQEILSIVHDARQFRPEFGRLPDSTPRDWASISATTTTRCEETEAGEFLPADIGKDLEGASPPRKLDRAVCRRPAHSTSSAAGWLVEAHPLVYHRRGLAGHARNTIGLSATAIPTPPGGQLLAAKTGENFLFEKLT